MICSFATNVVSRVSFRIIKKVWPQKQLLFVISKIGLRAEVDDDCRLSQASNKKLIIHACQNAISFSE